MKIDEVVDIIENQKKGDDLLKFIKENPNYAQKYVELKTLEINLALSHIGRVTLDLAYSLDTKESTPSG